MAFRISTLFIAVIALAACAAPVAAGLDAGTNAGVSADVDGGCPAGQALHVANGIDLCMPKTVCTAETCPPQLGSCVDGACVFDRGYSGVQTFPEAWATYYCELSSGGCNGVTQLAPPATTAADVAAQFGLSLCGNSSSSGTCVGVAASSAMVIGNSEEAVDPRTNRPVANWGLGLTEASGLCYRLEGPGGSAIVALTDRCGGYCKCNGSGFEECGPCVNAADMEVNCSCVGTVPGVYSACCGDGCATTAGDCDWCASNNHAHFDLDLDAFNHVCGSEAAAGSCQLLQAQYVPCLPPNPAWPPAQSGSACLGGTFFCETPLANSDQLAGSDCCCEYNLCPQSDGTCAALPSQCKAGSCGCVGAEPDSEHPLVPSTGCCCVYGTTPQSDGTCK